MQGRTSIKCQTIPYNFICNDMWGLKKCWKSVCDKVQRKRTIDEGDESWAGGYFNHRNINSRQEYYHFLNQNIAALLSARGTFSEKIFFDLDWITPERCDADLIFVIFLHRDFSPYKFRTKTTCISIKLQINCSNSLQKSEISPHDRFFCDKY